MSSSHLAHTISFVRALITASQDARVDRGAKLVRLLPASSGTDDAASELVFGTDAYSSNAYLMSTTDPSHTSSHLIFPFIAHFLSDFNL